MKFGEMVFEALYKLPVVEMLPDLAVMLERAEGEMPPSWLLPAVLCEAVGGEREEALEGAMAIACSQLSIILVDDLLDEDERGEHHRVGVGGAANYAAALQAAGIQILMRSGLGEEEKLEAIELLSGMMQKTAAGQWMDTQNPNDEKSYWELIRWKSSPYYAAAFQIGAFFGGAGGETAEQIHQLGALYGEMVQIHDDLGDTMEVPANPDWRKERYPLPILFGATVKHRERERFLELRTKAADEAALKEAQEILIRCGAVGYCAYQLVERDKSAREMVAKTKLAKPENVEKLFAEIIQPVWSLMEMAEEEEIRSQVLEGEGGKE